MTTSCALCVQEMWGNTSHKQVRADTNPWNIPKTIVLFFWPALYSVEKVASVLSWIYVNIVELESRWSEWARVMIVIEPLLVRWRSGSDLGVKTSRFQIPIVYEKSHACQECIWGFIGWSYRQLTCYFHYKKAYSVQNAHLRSALTQHYIPTTTRIICIKYTFQTESGSQFCSNPQWFHTCNC